MRSFQPSAAAVIDERLNLVALLRELERLREQAVGGAIVWGIYGNNIR